jgi:hypothetical protein
VLIAYSRPRKLPRPPCTSVTAPARLSLTPLIAIVNRGQPPLHRCPKVLRWLSTRDLCDGVGGRLTGSYAPNALATAPTGRRMECFTLSGSTRVIVNEVRLMVLARNRVSSKQTTGTGGRRVGQRGPGGHGSRGMQNANFYSFCYYNLRDCYTILFRLPHQKQAEPGVCLYAVQW